MKMKKVCSWLLVFALIVSMFSGTVLADEAEIAEETQITEEEVSQNVQGTPEETDIFEADVPYADEAGETDILPEEEITETPEADGEKEDPEYEKSAWEEAERGSYRIFAADTSGEDDAAELRTESKLTAEAAGSGTDSSYITTGTYSYSSNEGKNIQETDTFVFREDCFMRSSFDGCDHLMLLSAQASLASASRYGDEQDAYEKDTSDNGYNIRTMLTDMGFEDVETNKYYTVEKLMNSAAAAVGHRKISAYGKDYTLLAIIPRSAGYKQEWSGNFSVGTGYIHSGFKAGRDEILRFVKQYISEHKISGNLKVWIAGHSRGSALSNLLGGFFAGGGIQYFGNNVSITPQDVYCYTFATPKTIREGLTQAEALSVEGYRGGVYKDDTPGEAYVSLSAGTITPGDAAFGGIRNYPLTYDVVTYLPMSEWGYTYYGSIFDITEGLSADSMMEEVGAINPYVYKQLKTSGDIRTFREMFFDLASFAVRVTENTDSGKQAMEGFVQRIITKMKETLGETSTEYVESGYEEAMEAAAGVYGMLLCILSDKVPQKVNELIMPAVLGYFAHASKKLQEEGKADSDEAAVSYAIVELIRIFTREKIDPATLTLDDAVGILAKFLADNSDSALAKKLESLLDESLSDDMKSLISGAFGEFHKDPDNATAIQKLMAFFSAAAYGADPDSEVGKTGEYTTGRDVRNIVYTLLPLLLSTKGISVDVDADTTVKDFVKAIFQLFMQEKDDNGNVIKEYKNLGEAADAALIKALDNIMDEVYGIVEESYIPGYKEMVQGYVDGVKKNMTRLRELVYNTFLSGEKEFSIEDGISMISTLIGNADMVATAHYNEVFVGWAKVAVMAGREASNHYITHVNCEESKDSPNVHWEYWVCHDKGTDKIYKDRSLSEEGKEEHSWAKPTYKLSDDGSTMTASRACTVNPDHTQSETAATERKVDTPATTDQKGKATYTATFEDPNFEAQTQTVTVPAIKKVSLSKTSFTYNAAVQKPTVTVTDTAGKKLVQDTDYTVSYSNSKSKNAGTYKVTVKFKGLYSGTKTVQYKIVQANNKITVKTKSKTVKYSKLKSKDQTFNLKASVKEKAKTTFSQVSVTKKAKGYISVSKAGKVTVKKGLKKGTYYLQVKVTANKTKNYKKTSKTQKIKITVK